MKEVLKPYVPVCQAIATLLQPHAEVVLHDLATGNIAYIANAFSKRRPGDSSMTDLDVAISIDSSVIGPYRKTNWDRRQLRSVTAVLRDHAERPVGLLCVNLDISAFEGAVEFIRNLIQFSPPSDPPAALFKSDWKEVVSATIDAYLREKRLTEAGLSKDDLSELVGILDRQGIFSIRNATPYIAEVLKMSRATLYKHLKDLRQKKSGSNSSENYGSLEEI
ncbi:transcriptional regulator [Rhizobium sp. BE258]|jgi:predicted transcriptional regulator YheO|uniref:helix-turn-helix transcriptional regulator n=2 Tax=Pseudomonadati TaxID=3379134 RepID=UPI000DD4F087|nr:PAS domain-containing protein [Rhizobium sp. BE258]